MIKKFWLNFKQKDISRKLYVVALIIIIFAVIFIKLLGVNIFLGMFYVSMILIEIGFIIWVYNFIKNHLADKIKKYNLLKYTKFLWIFFHLAVLWLATVYSSMIVNVGLGLPASDFNYTVSFFTFFCYIPAFLFIATALGLIIYLILMSGYFLLSIFNQQKISKSFSIFHIVGFVIIIGLFAFGHDKIMTHFITNAQQYVRFIAYQTDYQYVPAYLKQFPKMDQTVKIKLHENGVYSTLTDRENGFELQVEKLE
jgi:hypothetical protein